MKILAPCKIVSLVIWAHGSSEAITFESNSDAGIHKIQDVSAQHFTHLDTQAPIFLRSCSTAKTAKVIAEKSHHIVYAPIKSSYGDLTFLVPNKKGVLEMLQHDLEGNRITRVYSYKNDKLLEQEPEAYQ